MPPSVFPRSEADVREYVEDAAFPIVLKCINAVDAPPSAPRVLIARDREELHQGYRLMEAP